MNQLDQIPEKYREYPLREVIRDFQLAYALGAGERDETLAKLEPLAPEVRILALLGMPAYHLDRNPDEGLHSFFFMSGGVAPEVALALNGAGFSDEAQLVTKAIRLFGPTFPLDNEERMNRFGYTTGPELNSFDRKLMAVAAAFEQLGDFEQKVESFVRRAPLLLAMLRQHAQSITPRTRAEWLALQLWRDVESLDDARALKRYLAKSEPLRAYMAIAQFEWEVSNGGLHQFFSNSSGAIAPEVPDALDTVGLGASAQLIREALALFAQPYERRRAERFDRYFDTAETSPLEQRLYDLTDGLYAVDGEPTYLKAPLLFAEKFGLIPDIEQFWSGQ